MAVFLWRQQLCVDIASHFYAVCMPGSGQLCQESRFCFMRAQLQCTHDLSVSRITIALFATKAVPLPAFVRLGNLLHSRCMLLVRLVFAKGALVIVLS